jgi:predicted ABC-type ATPase
MAGEISKSTMESAYKDVERDALARTTAQENPKAILLGGQPGSGKSVLAAEAVRELRANGGAVVIDADRMREENPRYKQLSRVDPQNAADRTQKEAGEWAIRLTVAAVENRRNLVVDGTMRSPENIRDLTSQLKDKGYEVEARVMAVNPETSAIRARLRFEEQVAERGTGRFVNKEQHDNAYTGMVESVRALERDRLADSVRVYDANQRQIYEHSQERGGLKGKAEAVQVLEQERGRAWTHAERRDYVSALDDINALAKQREGVRDNVTYIVGGAAAKNDAKDYSNVNDAARAFREAKAEDQPYVIRIERLPNGRESTSTPGQTTYAERDGVREYSKSIDGRDEAFRRAYAEALRPEQERAVRPVLADRDELAVKLVAARNDLARFEQTPIYQRAQAFDHLTKREALARHPELDGTYKQLHDIRQGFSQTPQDQRETSYFKARAELSEQLHRGRVPDGNVSLDESRRVIDMAASHRGLVVRDAQELKQDVKGEVVASSSHHALVKMSDMVAVRYEKDGLDRGVRVGEKVTIQHGNEKSQVYEQGKEPARDNARDVGRDMGR